MPGDESLESRVLTVIGLMSGTSMDGIDAALIETDGVTVKSLGPGKSQAYDDQTRKALRKAIDSAPRLDLRVSPHTHFKDLSCHLADLHADVVLALLADSGLTPEDVDLLGFHGQTILHLPDQKTTWQIGDAPFLRDRTGIDVVADFRQKDVAAGGQGAPFAPLYHAALVRTAREDGKLGAEDPVAILNLGGVGNVTWIGGSSGLDILAFDTGPANAMLDDWMATHGNLKYDEGGRIAASGRVNEEVLGDMLDHKYFTRTPPKSLDRQDFSLADWPDMTLEDGAATLTEFTARSVARAREHMPVTPQNWFVCGGGRHNDSMMRALARQIGVPVQPVEALGWRGDTLEAEAFGFLAVRALKELPLSLPTTTGVPGPMPGGVLFSRR